MQRHVEVVPEWELPCRSLLRSVLPPPPPPSCASCADVAAVDDTAAADAPSTYPLATSWRTTPPSGFFSQSPQLYPIRCLYSHNRLPPIETWSCRSCGRASPRAAFPMCCRDLTSGLRLQDFGVGGPGGDMDEDESPTIADQTPPSPAVDKWSACQSLVLSRAKDPSLERPLWDARDMSRRVHWPSRSRQRTCSRALVSSCRRRPGLYLKRTDLKFERKGLERRVLRTF